MANSHKVADKSYELTDSSIETYQQYHADLLAGMAMKYIPFVELSEEQQLCKCIGTSFVCCGIKRKLLVSITHLSTMVL